jgi:type IV pilus assembly protein PilB
MVGEIRDSETAELSIHAALTGHLVFSTLHTNDALGAASRLIDMGVEGFLLSASLRAVAAQRLVRRVCADCREATKVPESVMARVREMLSNIPTEDVAKYGIMDLREMRFMSGKGCEACGNTGYKGRIAIYEIIALSPEMKDIIADGKNVDARLREQALTEGAITMKQDGILKAILGLTTLDEVERVTEGKFVVASDAGEEDEQIV